ncbi:TlyA family RNA methyltransferase [Desulforhopalus singaporensis]|uniref:23S rRNA (Cytidine1920-2'-O)/16S rRNA (Cytidine1409-2'-O)-methyltransferase n=1 Tax=Desulforhopalus singaporensis TaxID=91360 RepID=A0A1H0PXL9_9BACT|nr:TlyA family RNA methyltransferase [Desulforhopalus singaporensis]SDP09276.1 23S rRNA (cytidine1920-2'-O)/16S rRNA (cytidine1409-2'-O)-methyltransferase [Desulforhopalus singaporensis]
MKVRLDQLLVDKRLAPDLKTAGALIGAGEIHVDDILVDKAGTLVDSEALIRAKQRCPYVSRGGLKLEKAIDYFQIDVRGLTCIDIGSSTGGFTDCLLQHGAGKVFAVDVAYGMLAWKIRQDPRVEVLERFNARHIGREDINCENISLAVMDVSFISVTKIIPPLLELFTSSAAIITLIKPQFELAREEIGPGGIVTDKQLHQKAIDRIELFAADLGLENKGIVTSPILGQKGNREFLIYLHRKS